MARVLLLALALALVGVPSARAEGVGVSVGPVLGGGVLGGAITQVQLSRETFLEASLGVRPGWAVGRGFYPNTALGLGASFQWGKRSFRNGLFGNLNATLPTSFFESWIAFGWSGRAWFPGDRNSFTIQLGPGIWLARDLPAGTNLHLPGFVSMRFAWHFMLVDRGGNESERPERPRRRRGRDAEEEPAPEPAAPAQEPAPTEPPP